LSHHRKFARLSRLLGSEVVARGTLELLWDVAYENGDELLGDAGDVEYLGKWGGESGKLAAALVESGFVDASDGDSSLRVHDLWDHAPDYVRKRRTRETERQAKGRKLRSESGQCPPDGSQCPPNGRTRSPSPSPSPSPPPTQKKQEENLAGADAPVPLKPPANPRHKAVVDLLVAAFTKELKAPYHFVGGKDAAAVKTLLGYGEATDEEIGRRVRVHLADEFNRKQASIAWFVSRWVAAGAERVMGKGPVPAERASADAHDPNRVKGFEKFEA